MVPKRRCEKRKKVEKILFSGERNTYRNEGVKREKSRKNIVFRKEKYSQAGASFQGDVLGSGKRGNWSIQTFYFFPSFFSNLKKIITVPMLKIV